MSDTCAWCDAPKTLDEVCPRCGANYAKAEAIKLHGAAKPEFLAGNAVASLPPEERLASLDSGRDDPPDYPVLIRDPLSEWKNCLLAFPVMLLGAWACQYWNRFDGFQRIVFGMPLHELGHAVTAWMTGYNAIPGLWVTMVSPDRGIFATLMLFLLYAVLLRYGHNTRQRYWYGIVAVLFVLQMIGTFSLSEDTAGLLITFGGDGFGMVMATIMMSTFYLGKETQLYKGSVRWGLLFWGAAAFMDMFMAWWEGQSDIARVGYGKTGGRLSYAYQLINLHFWSWEQMISRHLMVGYGCLLAMTILYALGLWQSAGWVKQQALADKRAGIRMKSARPGYRQQG